MRGRRREGGGRERERERERERKRERESKRVFKEWIVMADIMSAQKIKVMDTSTDTTGCQSADSQYTRNVMHDENVAATKLLSAYAFFFCFLEGAFFFLCVAGDALKVWWCSLTKLSMTSRTLEVWSMGGTLKRRAASS